MSAIDKRPDYKAALHFVGEAVHDAMKMAERTGRDGVLWELGPLLCSQHSVGGCDGPLVYTCKLRGRVVPVCAQHLPILLNDPAIYREQAREGMPT